MPSKSQNRNKNVKKHKNSNVLVPSGHGRSIDSSSNQVATVVRSFVSSLAAPKANINVSTGASTYTNAQNSITCFAPVNTNVTSDCCYSMFFMLNDIPQSSTFTALFDQYRIRRIDVTFAPNYSNVALLSSTQALTVTPNQLWYTVDLDDASVASPLSALQEYESIKCVELGVNPEPFTVSFKPHVAVAAYSGAFTSYANQPNEWIDCGSPSVQHYGIKWGTPCPVNTSFGIPSYNIICRYYIDFRTTR
jgi:hypothetical protein